MSYKVKTILLFDKQAKRLSKKYPSIKNDISILIKKLEDNPREGIPLAMVRARTIFFF